MEIFLDLQQRSYCGCFRCLLHGEGEEFQMHSFAARILDAL
jgi:hypothetical protein